MKALIKACWYCRMDAGEEEMRNFGKAIGRAIIDFVKKHYRKYVLDS